MGERVHMFCCGLHASESEGVWETPGGLTEGPEQKGQALLAGVLLPD